MQIVTNHQAFTWYAHNNRVCVLVRLDYPGIGPEHAFFHESGRAEYYSVTDEQALAAFERVSRMEGIIPALETAHALAYLEVSVEGRTTLQLLLIAHKAESVGFTNQVISRV